MDKGTGEKLLVDGKEVTAESIFIPEKPTGTVEMAFTFPASALAGKTIVVFESVYHEGKEVAVHADLEDEDQTIIIRRKGGLLIRKTSEDDFVEGISFIVAGEGYEETFVTDKQGEIYVQDLVPGEYTVTEVENDVTAKYIIEAGKTVTITSGDEPAEVEFHNKLKRGSVYVVKTAVGAPNENLSGAEFSVYTDVDGNGEFDKKPIPRSASWSLRRIATPCPICQWAVTSSTRKRPRRAIPPMMAITISSSQKMGSVWKSPIPPTRRPVSSTKSRPAPCVSSK